VTIGILLPYSGEFAGLKRALLDPVKSFAAINGSDIITEFIHDGQKAKVEQAIDKLFYGDDVDIIIGYLGYKVAVAQFDKLRSNSDKLFIHVSLGEIIPYTHALINYPPNYCLISYEAWKCETVLGDWVARQPDVKSCMVCTSSYDVGYSLHDSFRIGYHSNSGKELSNCILKRDLDGINTTPLFEEIDNAKPDHLHVILCGLELDDFIKRFDDLVTYKPSVSFALPVAVNNYASAHPSLRLAYTAFPDKVSLPDLSQLAADANKTLINYIVSRATYLLTNEFVAEPETIAILKMDFNGNNIAQTGYSNILPAALNASLNYAAEHSHSCWQNPYLCISR